MEGSYVYIEYTVPDSQQRMILQLGVGQGLTTPYHKKNQNITNCEIGSQDEKWLQNFDQKPEGKRPLGRQTQMGG